MARVLRGELYWADLEPVIGHEQGGRRPVVVISHDAFNERSGTVIAMAITSAAQRAGYPLTWALPTGILSRPSWVKITQIRTLAAERLGSRLGRLEEHDLQQLVEGLVQLVG